MGPRGRSDDAPDPRSAAPADDGTTDSLSSFNAAQDLLQAALDEVRSAPPETKAAPGGPARTPPARPDPTAGPTNQPQQWAPSGPTSGKRRTRGRRPSATAQGTRSPQPTPPAAPTPANAPPDRANTPTNTPTDTPTDAPRNRRRSRRGSDGAATAAAAGATDNFDGLTDDLFQEPSRHRRRRTAAAASPDLPPMPGPDNPFVEAQPIEAVAAVAATTAPESKPEATAPKSPRTAELESPWTAAPVGAAATAAVVADAVVASQAAEVDGGPSVDETAEELLQEAIAVAAVSSERPAAARRARPAGAPPARPAPPAPVVPSAVPTAAELDESSLTADDRQRRTRRLVAALVVIGLVVAGLSFALLSGGGSGDEDAALNTPPGARLTFPAVTTPEGAEVTRVWELRGAGGDRFVGQLQFENPLSVPIQATFTETIPKSLAASTNAIAFDPEPVVVDPDPVVRYTIPLAAGATVTARYRIEVAPEGTDRSRLQTWADEVTTPTTTTTTPPAPTTTPTTAPATTPTTAPTRGTTATTAPAPPVTFPPPPPPTQPPPPPPPTETGSLVLYVTGGGDTTFTFATPFGNVDVPGNGVPVGQQVDVGQYTVTLLLPEGWLSDGVSCGPGASGSGTSATFDIQANSSVRCTFRVHHA